MKPIKLADPRLVALRPRDRDDAARLLAVLLRETAIGSGSGYAPEEQARPAAELPTAPSLKGKRRRRKGAGEAA